MLLGDYSQGHGLEAPDGAQHSTLREAMDRREDACGRFPTCAYVLGSPGRIWFEKACNEKLLSMPHTIFFLQKGMVQSARGAASLFWFALMVCRRRQLRNLHERSTALEPCAGLGRNQDGGAGHGSRIVCRYRRRTLHYSGFRLATSTG